MTGRSHPLRARRALGVAGACLAPAGAAVVALLLGAGSPHRRRPAVAQALGTAVVTRGSLVTTEHFGGRLRYPARGSVRLTAAGVVTALPRVGQVLRDGSAVASVDDRPIGVLYGRTPLYRTLGRDDASGAALDVQEDRADLLAAEAALARTRLPQRAAGPQASEMNAAAVAEAQVAVAEARRRLSGARQTFAHLSSPQQGPDVTLVSGDMASLGDDAAVSSTWTPALSDAVRDWQTRLGAIPDGVVAPADVIVVPGAVRVTGVAGQVGDSPSAVTLSLSAARRVASFTLRHGVPAGVRPGRRVRLSDAADDRAAGRVSAVTQGTRSATVTVELAQGSALARTTATRVTMTVVTADQPDVTLVPTQALLALGSGGFAVQRPDGDLIAVHTGAVQGGEIAVSGAGVTPGLRVVSVR